MAWMTLGTVTLTFEWQFLGLEQSIFRETFRITHYNWALTRGGCLIAQVFDDLFYDFYGVHKLFPSKERRIITLDIPKDLLSQSEPKRYIGLKLSPRARVYAYDWKVQIEALT